MAKVKRKKRRAQAPEIVHEVVAAPAPAEAAPDEAAPRKSGQFQDVVAVVKPEMLAYFFWREWWKARERGDFDFVFELSAESSSLRESFGPREEFGETCRRRLRPVLGLTEGELRLIRLHGESEAYLINAIGLKERERRSYTAERWFMLRGESGWRVHQIDAISVGKDKEPSELSLADFPTVAFPDGVKAEG
ncbi:MAG: hypothetical protein ACJAYU_004380 [Bradymonadia bacterium]|jgi:hypothetical protein